MKGNIAEYINDVKAFTESVSQSNNPQTTQHSFSDYLRWLELKKLDEIHKTLVVISEKINYKSFNDFM